MTVSATYPVVTQDGFPHGLRCAECHQPIEVGQPYSEHIYAVGDGGDTHSVLACVYCPTGGEA